MGLAEAILGLLYEKPKTGYEIKKFYRDTIRHFWNVSDGQLYPTLKKMTEEGYIVKKETKEEEGLKKHLYSITTKGKERFMAWLKKPVDKFEEMKEPFLIKLFFFDKLSDEDKLYHLKVQYDVHQEVLNEFLDVKKLYAETLSEYQRIITDLGILYVQVRIFLLLRLMDMVKNKREEPFLPDKMPELLWKLYYIIFSGEKLEKYFKNEFFNLKIEEIEKSFGRKDEK